MLVTTNTHTRVYHLHTLTLTGSTPSDTSSSLPHRACRNASIASVQLPSRTLLSILMKSLLPCIVMVVVVVFGSVVFLLYARGVVYAYNIMLLVVGRHDVCVCVYVCAHVALRKHQIQQPHHSTCCRNTLVNTTTFSTHRPQHDASNKNRLAAIPSRPLATGGS